MNKMVFDIKNKGKRITSIEADNFKDSIKEFAETYDMPDSELDKGNEDNIFSANHSDTEIEFRYIYRDRAYVEYQFEETLILLKIEKSTLKQRIF